jgi:hypothetical protein
MIASLALIASCLLITTSRPMITDLSWIANILLTTTGGRTAGIPNIYADLRTVVDGGLAARRGGLTARRGGLAAGRAGQQEVLQLVIVFVYIVVPPGSTPALAAGPFFGLKEGEYMLVTFIYRFIGIEHDFPNFCAGVLGSEN